MLIRNSDTGDTQEISLRLEHYEDIFSDFDIRPYSKRALSVDFLDEVKRATVDKSDSDIELLLFAPTTERSESHEATIRERLAEHFKRHYEILRRKKKATIKWGLLMVLLGIAASAAAAIILFQGPEESLFMSFLVVFLEPAAWFLLWEGMDQILFSSRELNSELTFYRKMAGNHHRIHFKSY